MTKIDAFTHVLPKAYLQKLQSLLPPDYLGGMVAAMPELYEVEKRLAIMDELGIDAQVITISSPPIEVMVQEPRKAHDLARLANDGIAEMAQLAPKRFIPVGTVAMNAMDLALDETERCIKNLGMKGMLIYSNAVGKPIDTPEFIAFYELMAKLDVPLWLHPARSGRFADYVGEESSRYEVWQVFGWPYETTIAMTRLAFSGIFDRFPHFKVITHHAGGMVPFFEKRIEHCYRLFGKMSLQEAVEKLQKPIIDYFRLFYADTALMGSVGGLLSAYSFFGAERLLFGTDSPFDFAGGKVFNQETIFTINALPITPAERQKIFAHNLQALLGLT